MRLKEVITALVALVLATSCINEPLVEGGCSGDGTPTPVTLSIRGDRFPGEQDAPANPFGGVPKSRALTDEKEATITQLHLLVFDSNGEAVLNERFKNLTLTDGIYRLQTEALPGNGMQFYVVANADIAGLFAENLPLLLNAITRFSELETLITNLQGGTNGLNRTDRLLMVGNATVNITKPHREAIPLTLNYLAAKVTVTLTDNTNDKLDIDITGWDMVNVPKKSYLSPLSEKDAVTGTRPEDYLTTASKFLFETVNKETKSWAHTCYLFENRRGGRVDRPAPTNPADQYPDMDVNDNNQRGKAWYAPAGATYLLVYGTHFKDGQKNNILYKIYLGANAVNDYNLVRGKHYKYNVSINGLNDIDIDTNVEWGAASFTIDKSDNLKMDAHPDVRVLRIGGTATDAQTPAYATVEVVSGNTWLSLSPLNLYRHAVKQPGNAGEHQQFGSTDGVGSFVRSRYTPSVTATADFGEGMAFGMTRQLTRIPFNQLAVCTYQDVLVYADAYNEGGERTGQLRIIYYKGANGDEVVGQQTLTVTQSGAMEVSPHLYMERYEESAMTLHPALASELQHVSFMQWGYNTAQLYNADDRFCNGNYLTANAVYNNVGTRSGMDSPQWTATVYDDYRSKYPRTGGEIKEPSSVTTSGTPYYYPDLTQSTLATDYFHPIYNSSAARYCHEKNRDTNGDGNIDDSETVWYLPSYSDMIAIKTNPPAINPLIGTYWTSTEESEDKSWAFTFPAGTMEAVDKRITNRVRCVRGTGVPMTEPTFVSEEEDKSKITLSSDAEASGIFRITDDKNFGLPWTVTSDAPDWLQVAADAQGTAVAATQTGTGNATLYAYAATANPSKEASRSATLTFTRALFVDKAIEVTQELSTAIVGGNSNCYMIAPGAAVSIPVERANESFVELQGSTLIDGTYHQLQASTAWTASLVWESSIGLVTLSEAAGTGSAGRFNVTATSTSTEGNAVVAIKSGGNILWSWHIWVTAYDGKATFTNNNGKQDFVFMDRALGATSATPGELSSCGLHYQWGRKDPFPGIGQPGGSWSIPPNTDPIKVYNDKGIAYAIPKTDIPSDAIPNNLTNAIRCPDTFYHNNIAPYDWFTKSNSGQNHDLWSGGNIALATPAPKSVFDPCPAGWRIVPWLSNTSPFATMNGGFTWDSHGCTWPGTGGYFPVMGYRYHFNGGIDYVSTYGYIWSGSPNGAYGYYIYYGSGAVDTAHSYSRAFGFSVRCCRDNL